MAKKKLKLKQIVRLRDRTLVDGSKSLYFDVYFKGKRWTTSPGLFLSPLKSHTESNKEILLLAENIRCKMQLDIVHGRYGFVSESSKKMNAVVYFEDVYNQKKQNFKPSNQRLWKSALKHFGDFVNGNIQFPDINEQLLEGYKLYLLKHIGARTSHYYFMVLKQVLNSALKDKIIVSNPASFVKGIPFKEGEIIYLTRAEILKLKATECQVDVVKRAFIFSIYTSLRHVDLKQLRWGMITYSDEAKTSLLTFVQQKTGNPEYKPLSKETMEWLGEQGASTELIFKGLHKCTAQNNAFKNWLIAAKISKPISFHKARVTFGVLQHASGTDASTIQKMLGHTSFKSTERYFTVGDKKILEASDRIKL